ncbi:Uncharacterised protein [Mycobacteroides abscessus subsp. massiliense]|nr:Uncharacterised protein [Mycobacteroides abscessus subsp. massiliense]
MPNGCSEHREGGIALELVDHALVSVDFFDDDGKESVQQCDHLDGRPGGCQLGGSNDIGEKHCDVAFFAAERGLLQLGGSGDLAADMLAEEQQRR